MGYSNFISKWMILLSHSEKNSTALLSTEALFIKIENLHWKSRKTHFSSRNFFLPSTNFSISFLQPSAGVETDIDIGIWISIYFFTRTLKTFFKEELCFFALDEKDSFKYSTALFSSSITSDKKTNQFLLRWMFFFPLSLARFLAVF